MVLPARLVLTCAEYDELYYMPHGTVAPRVSVGQWRPLVTTLTIFERPYVCNHTFPNMNLFKYRYYYCTDDGIFESKFLTHSSVSRATAGQAPLKVVETKNEGTSPVADAFDRYRVLTVSITFWGSGAQIVFFRLPLSFPRTSCRILRSRYYIFFLNFFLVFWLFPILGNTVYRRRWNSDLRPDSLGFYSII